MFCTFKGESPRQKHIVVILNLLANIQKKPVSVCPKPFKVWFCFSKPLLHWMTGSFIKMNLVTVVYFVCTKCPVIFRTAKQWTVDQNLS